MGNDMNLPEGVTEQHRAIQSKWNIDPYTLNKFLARFPDDPNTNNCRYDLVFGWVRQGKIKYRQFKILVKNIRIRNIDQWKQMNGDWFFKQEGVDEKEPMIVLEEIRVGDKIKYDTADSNFCCYGNVMKVCPKSVVVLTFGGYVVRVKNKDIACVY